MRNSYFWFFLLVVNMSWATDKTLIVHVEQSVQNDTLSLIYSIHNTGKDSVSLGSSNFSMKFAGKGLDLPKSLVNRKIASDFISTSSYRPLSLGIRENVVTLSVAVNTRMNGSGTRIASGERKIIGAIQIPITNPCEYQISSWQPMPPDAVNEFFNEAKGASLIDITDRISPDSMRLDGGKYTIKPVIEFEKGLLFTNKKENIQWYYEGDELPGETQSSLIPSKQGMYSVVYKTPCNEVLESESYKLIITDLPSLASNYKFQAEPNTFVNQTQILFELPKEAKGSIEYFDTNGRFLGRLFQGTFKGGKNTFPFDLNTLGISSGVYIVKLSFEGNVIPIKVLGSK